MTYSKYRPKRSLSRVNVLLDLIISHKRRGKSRPKGRTIEYEGHVFFFLCTQSFSFPKPNNKIFR